MLPNLKEVDIGTINGIVLDKSKATDWACPGVKILKIHECMEKLSSRSSKEHEDLLLSDLHTYFPNLDRRHSSVLQFSG